MQLLVFDNYDSFTYNLVHMVEKILHQKVTVVYNDRIDWGQIDPYDKMLISPGPGIPAEAGVMLTLIERYASTKSILGICLGHQGIASVMGAQLENLPIPFHGVAKEVNLYDTTSGLFEGLQPKELVGRYHSWVVSEENFPKSLEITARDQQGYVMGIKHRKYDVQGIQFHPESVLTVSGEQMMRNWLKS